MQKEIGRLEKTNEGLKSFEENIRKEFLKVLDTPLVQKGSYSYEREKVLYSWFEIFAEIGKLLQLGRSKSYEDTVRGLREDVDALIKKDLEQK